MITILSLVVMILINRSDIRAKYCICPCCNSSIGELSSNGLIQHSLKDTIPSDLSAVCRGAPDKVLGLKDLASVSGITMGGFIAAFVVLCLELSFIYWCKSRLNSYGLP